MQDPLSFAKRKLKYAIEHNQSTNMEEKTLMNGRVSMVQTEDSSDRYKDLFLDTDISLEDNLGDSKREINQQHDFSPDFSPEEKRQRFLERNRAAAFRCRQKRKMWVSQLESKSQDLMQTNSRLMKEINALRREVAQLKALLLAHKDCPVTQKQKSHVGDMAPESYVATASEGQILAFKQDMEDMEVNIATAEEVASSALTDMAARAPVEMTACSQVGIKCVSTNVM